MAESLDGDEVEGMHKHDHKRSDFMKLSGDIMSNINYKIAIFIFIIGMLLFSDVFIENILSGIGGSVEDGTPTTKGTVILLLFLVLAYIVLDLIVKYNII